MRSEGDGKGSPAASNSSRNHPAPKPSSTRLPDNRWSVLTECASSTGPLASTFETSVRRRSLEVDAAQAASTVTACAYGWKVPPENFGNEEVVGHGQAVVPSSSTSPAARLALSGD